MGAVTPHAQTRRMGSRTAIYTRLSKYLDPDSLPGTSKQEKDCRSLAELRSVEVVEVYTDLDLSAYRKNVERPGYERMLADVRSGLIDTVLVWKLDRLVRRSAEFERFWSVCEDNGVNLMSAMEPIDTSTELGMVIVRVLVAFAQLESATMSLRIKRGKQDAAQRGEPFRGGRRPFGLSADWSTVVDEEAELVRGAAKRVLAGESLRSIVTDWNTRGVATSTGTTWKQASLRHILVSPRVVGDREFRGEVIGRGNWPAILDRPTWERVRAILLDPSRTQSPGGVTRSLLGGLLECARCGKRMKSGVTSTGKRRYVCAPPPEGCGRCSILGDRLDDLVREVLVAAVDGEMLARMRSARHEQVDESALLAEIRADEDALGRLTNDYYVDRVIGRAEFFDARRALEGRIASSRRQMVKAVGDSAGIAWIGRGADLAAAWGARSVAWRRSTLELFVERIVVGPSSVRRGQFDSGRITPARGGDVVWRG